MPTPNTSSHNAPGPDKPTPNTPISDASSPNASTDTSTPDKAPNITTKINQLNQQVEWFYGDDFTLDQAAAKYQAAATLAKDIENDLATLQNEIEIIAKDFTKE